MKKSIFLFFAAVLCSVSAWGAALPGSWNNWNENGNVFSGNPAISKIELAANTSYKFKVKDGNWYGNNGTISSDIENWTFSTSDGDCTLKTNKKGFYVFKWSSKKLSVIYPHTYTVAGSSTELLGTSWDPTNTNNNLSTDDYVTYKLVKNNILLSAGDISFKVTVDNSWDKSYPSSDKTFNVSAKGYYDVNITFNVVTKEVKVETTLIKHTVTASANPAEGGTVTGGGEYAKGSDVTLKATPTTGYEFVNWTEGETVVSTSTQYNFTLLNDVNIVANFKIPEPDAVKYQVNVSANDNAMGTVTGGGEYEEEATALLTATPNAGYQFVNWTVGGVEKSTNTTYSFTVTEAVEVIANFQEIPKTTVYFVNNKNWSAVCAYAWEGTKGENQSWPGANITANKLAEKIGEFDVYSYTVEEGSHAKVIFNNNNNGSQTENFVWTDGKYYYMGAAADYAGGTKEDVTTAVAPDPLATDVYLVGEMNSWSTTANEFKKATAEATTASISVNLEAGTAYEFKVIRGGDWTSSKDNRDIKASVSGLVFSKDINDNTKMTTTIAGEYVFTWDINQSQLSIAYPSIPVDAYNVTVPEGTIECYIKGAFDDWAEFHKMTKVDETHYTISISGATTAHTYKYSSGASWDFEEVTADGGHVDSRTYNANDVVAKWKAVYDPDAVPQELVYNVTVPAGTTACYIAMDTDPAQEGWEFTAMTKVDDTHYTLTRTGLKSDAYKYACQPSWDYAEKTADGNDVANRVWAENDVVANWATPAAPAAKCYLMGNGDWDNGVEMTLNPGNENEFVLYCHHISAPFKFKYGEEWSDQVENAEFPGIQWVEDGNGQYNITLPEGLYDFYFKKDTKKVWIVEAGYVRNVTNTYGTICLPYASASTTGAYFYEVAGKEEGKVYLASVDALEAGVPYIFEATAGTITVTYQGEAVDAPQNDDANGLVGTFTNETIVPEGAYILHQNAFRTSNDPANPNKVNAYRAYLVMEDVPGEFTKMPGRRYIGMSVQGENAETGLENIIVPEGQAVKVISNGQLIIIRDGEMYNAQGQKL